MTSAKIIIPCLDVDHGKVDNTLAASVFHNDRYLIPFIKRFLRERGPLDFENS